MKLTCKILSISILAMILLYVFTPLLTFKSMANDSFLTSFFDKLSLKVDSSSINSDSSKKTVTITKKRNDSTYLKIKGNPNDWIVQLDKFEWLFFNPTDAPYNLKLINSNSSITISGNTFSGNDIDIAVYMQNASNALTNDEEEEDNSNNSNPVYKKGSRHIIKNEEYTIISEKAVSLYKSKTKSKKVTIPSRVKIGNKSFNVTEIGPGALRNNKTIKEINLPKTLTTIGEKSFYGCKNLKKVKCNIASLKKIKKQAFKGIKNDALFSLKAKNKHSYNTCVKLIKKAAPKSKFTFTMIKELYKNT